MLFVAALLAVGTANADSTVKIVLSLDAPGRPTVRYTPPPGVRRIDFADIDSRTHALVRSVLWDLEAECGVLQPERIVLRGAACRSVNVRLRADGGQQDRFYPSMIALENGGVLVFTKYLQVDAKQGNAAWVVIAPPGGVALFRDRISTDRIAFSSAELQADARGWIYLGPDEFDRQPSVNLLADRGLSFELAAEVKRMVPRLLTFFGENLGRRLDEVPSFFVTWNQRTVPGAFVQGDVAPGGVVRLSLGGSEWGALDTASIRRLRGLVAHELVHLWNAGPFRFKSDDPPWLHEGNAVLLSVAALFALGLTAKHETAERINVALNQCFIVVATNRIHGFEMDRGPAPYHCGLIVQFVILALWQQDHAGTTPFSFWREFWRTHPHYDLESFVRYVRAGSKSVSGRPGRFPEAAFETRGDAIKEALEAAAMTIGAMEILPDALRQTIAMHALVVVMSADCNGKISVSSSVEAIRVIGMAECDAFSSAMTIDGVSGRALLADPIQAVAAMTEECKSKGRITFRTADGRKPSVPCTERMLVDIQSGVSALKLDDDHIAAVLTGVQPTSSKAAPR